MSYEVRERYAKVQKDLQELLSAVSIIKAFTGEKRVTIRQLQSLKEAIRKEIRLDITATIASISSVIISAAGPIVLIWYGCYEIMNGNLTVGGLIAFSSFINYLFGPAQSLFNLSIGIQRSLAACERIFEIMDIAPEKEGKNDIQIKRGVVIFENVSFSYDDKEPVFENVSFSADSNETVAIVGRSGVGKTTLVSLIPRFYEIQKGKILIDGEYIKDAKLKSLRKQISIVAQDTFLFSDTIKENIRFGNPAANDEEVENAATLAYCEEFIKEMPDGYDTKIGERGVTLSGGQRQRISIARAILRNPRILILDEATSSLDSESERLIQGSLVPLMKDRTTFVIAHRLSTIRNADKIIVLDDHKIAGIGNHSKLYEICPAYKQLYNEQFLEKEII
jgi:ATP-binding cassette, subfamily B, bacterial MsbA